MSKIITGFEFAILVAIIIGIIILLNVMEARRRINAVPKEEDDDQAKEDEAQRRRMVHEADTRISSANMSPPVFQNWVEKEDFLAQAEADRQARSREAIRKAQIAARDSVRNAVREKEREYSARMTQHNSSFRALGITPCPTRYRLTPEEEIILWGRDPYTGQCT